MLKNMVMVNKTVIPLFKDAAQELIKLYQGDAEKALCSALAYMSGYYKN